MESETVGLMPWQHRDAKLTIYMESWQKDGLYNQKRQEETKLTKFNTQKFHFK